MSFNIRHFGRVEKGIIKFENFDNFQKDVKKYEGKKVAITVVQRKKLRSDAQNRYYWGVVIALIADYCGYDSKEDYLDIHEFFKQSYCPCKTRELFGKNLTFPKTTTTLDTKEFTKYVEHIKIYAAHEFNGLKIPEPNEVDIDHIKVDKSWHS